MLQAIDFAREQHDDDLWEDLLKYSETRPRNIFRVSCGSFVDEPSYSLHSRPP